MPPENYRNCPDTYLLLSAPLSRGPREPELLPEDRCAARRIERLLRLRDRAASPATRGRIAERLVDAVFGPDPVPEHRCRHRRRRVAPEAQHNRSDEARRPSRRLSVALSASQEAA